MSRIFLIGFPGCGKSTYGKKLSAKLHLSFIDLDTAFEQKYRISVEDFFAKYGEDAYRLCEHEVLLNAVENDDVLISCGGGTPCFFNHIDLMKGKGVVVYLQMSVASIVNRLTHAKRVRPLVKNLSPAGLEQYVSENMKIRGPIYEQAHLSVKAESPDVEVLAVQLMEIIKESKTVEYAENIAD